MFNRIELKYLRAIVTLADEMDLTRAADLLGVSQLTFNRYIAEVENSLELPLFVRDYNIVEITDRGRTFVEHARLCLLYIDDDNQT